jgi:dolichol-phosphate mannosyltransferase
MSSKTLTIIIPTYNEKKNIYNLIENILKIIKIKKLQIVVVDDDSKDGTYLELKKIKKKYKNFFYIVRKNKKRDLTKSVILGFGKSKYHNILVMDADFQHNPLDIIKLIKIFFSSKYDFVIGCRRFDQNLKKNLKLMRFYSSLIITYIFNLLLGYKTSDPMSGFFIFKKKIFLRNKKKLYGSGFKILTDLIYSEKNLKIKDIYINFDLRKYNKSKMNFKIILQIIILFFHKYYTKIFK